MAYTDLPAPEDDFDRSTLDIIRRAGWSILWIVNGPGESGPEYAYSAGIHHTLGHPEVLVMGLDRGDSGTLINEVGDAIRSGRRFEPGATYDGRPGLLVRFVAVPESLHREFVGYARWLYGGEGFPLLQMVWPDRRGLYPWEPGFDEGLRGHQIVLGEP